MQAVIELRSHQHPMTTRIIIADDHPIARAGARAIVEGELGSVVVAEAGSPEGLMEVLARRHCDVLLTDFTMPGEQPDGLPMLATVRRKYPAIGIVLFTAHTDSRLLELAVASGIKCIVNKRAAMDELPKAIRAALLQKAYISQSLRAEMTLGGASQVRERACRLSRREFEVLRLLAARHTVSEIAALSNRSVATISHQKVSAMRKLQLATDADLHVFLRSSEFAM